MGIFDFFRKKKETTGKKDSSLEIKPNELDIKKSAPEYNEIESAIQAEDNTKVENLEKEKDIDTNVKNSSVTEYDDIISSIQAGNIKKVESLLVNGNDIDINKKDNNGNTLIFHAVKNGNIEIVNLLLKNGSNINIKNNEGESIISRIITEAYNKKDLRIFELINPQEFDLNEIEPYKKDKFLELVIEKGRQDLVEIAINIGANINQDGDYFTKNSPLHLSLLGNFDEISKLLINKGANIFAENREGQRPLDIMMDSNKIDLIELVLTKLNKSVPAKFSILLYWFIGQKYNKMAINLYEHLIDIDAYSVLHSAFYSNNNEFIDYLISKDINIDLLRPYDKKPLLINALKSEGSSNCKVAKLLIERGANFLTIFNDTENYFESPLFLAYENNHREIVELIYSKLNFRINKSEVFFSISNNLKEQYRTLEFGGTFTCPGCNEIRVEDYSFPLEKIFSHELICPYCKHNIILEANLLKEKPEIEIKFKTSKELDKVPEIKILCLANKKEEDPKKQLYQVIKVGDIEKTKSIIESGIDINMANDKGITPLFYAIKNKQIEIIKLLLSKGANVNILCNNISAFSLAVDNIEIIKILLTNNIDVNQISDEWPKGMWSNVTPLMVASYNGWHEIVGLLIKSKADLELTTVNEMAPNMTPLSIACGRMHFDIVKSLLEAGANPNVKHDSGKDIIMIMEETTKEKYNQMSETYGINEPIPEGIQNKLNKIKDLIIKYRVNS